MGECRENQPEVKLFFALMTNRIELFDVIERQLSEEFGPMDLQDSIYDFDAFTTYYAAEFGKNQKKRIISAFHLIPPQRLVFIKRRTNEIEREWSESGENLNASSQRTINIDPGYLSLSKVILATTKDHAHRIYVGEGIFEEITLAYKKNEGYQPNPWTYPDYKAAERLEFFKKLRQVYCTQLESKNLGKSEAKP